MQTTMTLQAESARDIASEYREQFHSDAAFERSWTKCFEMCGNPTEARLREWLDSDLAKDHAMSVGIVREPLLPHLSTMNDLGDCYHCGGKWYVRKDVPIGHPDFGKAFPCPGCNR